jgi:tetratricopeptide (TPR) repeat protein
MTDARQAKRALRPKAARTPPTTPDAIEIAMEAEAAGAAPAGFAAQVLEGQVGLIAEQRKLIGWQVNSERASYGLKVLTGVVGVVAFVIVGLLLYSASQYRGLTVQPFSVPPELEARGANGSVVASRLLDQLSHVQANTNSLRAPNTYANSWGDDVEVEIPQTGVSAGELWKFLRAWLGQEVKITGEVVRTPAGLLQVTARAGGQPTPVFSGPEDQLEALLTQAAESLYGSTQPYRYGIYLSREEREAESLAVLEALAATGSVTDRKWALAGWSLALQGTGDFERAIETCSASIALDPKFGLALANCGGVYSILGQAEQAYLLTRRSAPLFRGGRDIAPAIAAPFTREMRGFVLEMEHDALGSARAYAEAAAIEGTAERGNRQNQARMLALAHDLTSAKRLLRSGTTTVATRSAEGAVQETFSLFAALSLEDWASAVAAEAELRQDEEDPVLKTLVTSTYRPMVAYARARLGDLARAEASLEGAPLDSYWVLIAHGQIAAIKGDVAASERWFARAARAAPSLADADQAWGRARLDRRDFTGAIDRFEAAARAAPRWAEPLKGWGDALAGQGDHRGALRRYRAAEDRAPRWGALHIAWGRSLAALGRTQDAQAKWREAEGMDLSPADRAAVRTLLAA